MMRYKNRYNCRVILTVKPLLLALVWSVYVEGIYEFQEPLEDGRLSLPIDKLGHGVTDLVTFGKTPQLDLDKAELARSAALLFLRTGFPALLTSGVVSRMHYYFEGISQQVASTNIEHLERKSPAEICEKMTAIFDTVIEHIGSSSRGIYSDISAVQVDGRPLSDAIVEIGLQFKAYRSDLNYYRDVTQKLLSVPIIPKVISIFSNIMKETDILTPGTLKRLLIHGSTNEAISALPKPVDNVSRKVISHSEFIMDDESAIEVPTVSVEVW